MCSKQLDNLCMSLICGVNYRRCSAFVLHIDTSSFLDEQPDNLNTSLKGGIHQCSVSLVITLVYYCPFFNKQRGTL